MRNVREGWVLGAVLALALGFRLAGHLDSGLWFDEIWLLVDTIRQPFGVAHAGVPQEVAPRWADRLWMQRRRSS